MLMGMLIGGSWDVDENCMHVTGYKRVDLELYIQLWACDLTAKTYLKDSLKKESFLMLSYHYQSSQTD